MAASAGAVPIWQASKTGLGYKKGPPVGSGADKCTVVKACTTGAGIKWDPVALGVKKGAMDMGGKTPRQFLSKKTY